MSRSYRKIIRNRKQRIERRLAQGKGRVLEVTEGAPVMSASNIHYEMSDRAQGMSYGGIGAIHQMVGNIGLPRELDRLGLLKVYAPYHESDHVLNIAYNTMLGGIRLEDIDLRRNDEVF